MEIKKRKGPENLEFKTNTLASYAGMWVGESRLQSAPPAWPAETSCEGFLEGGLQLLIEAARKNVLSHDVWNGSEWRFQRRFARISARLLESRVLMGQPSFRRAARPRTFNPFAIATMR